MTVLKNILEKENIWNMDGIKWLEIELFFNYKVKFQRFKNSYI